MRTHILAAMTTVLVLALATVAMAADPFVGTWKWKPTTPPEATPYKSWIAKIEAQGNGYYIVQDGAGPDVKALHLESAVIFDEKEHPVPGGSQSDTTTATRIDTYAFVTVNKRDGREYEHIHFSVSQDGKTTTLLYKRKNQQGEDVTFTRVLDKQ